MRLIGWMLLCLMMAAPGCGTSKSSGAKAQPAKSSTIVTPADSLTGRISMINKAGGYAIVTFPIGRLPGNGQTLSVYRKGLKVGELKVNGPQVDNLVTADFVTGDCRSGDEARLQ